MSLEGGALIGAAAISSGTSFLNSGIASGVSRRNAHRQRRHERNQAARAYERNLELWDKANEYNHPLRQMERLKSAGLNPRLVYGGKGAGNNPTGNAPGQAAPYKESNAGSHLTRKPMHIPDVIGSYMNMRSIQANIDNTNANTELVMQQKANESVNNAIKAHFLTYGSEGQRFGETGVNRKMAHEREKGKSVDVEPWFVTKLRAEGKQSYELARYSQEVAKENLLNLRNTNRQILSNVGNINARTMGQVIANQYARPGLGNSPWQAKMVYNQLLDSGMSKNKAAQALIAGDFTIKAVTAATGAAVAKGALKGLKQKKPGYTGPNSGRLKQKRVSPYGRGKRYQYDYYD